MQTSQDNGADHTDSAEGAPIATRGVELGVALALMALALVVFGAWRPGLALLGALLYAWFDAYQLRLQHVFPGVPYQIFLMAPYVLSIAVLIPMSRRASGPQALMMPFVKGER